MIQSGWLCLMATLTEDRTRGNNSNNNRDSTRRLERTNGTSDNKKRSTHTNGQINKSLLLPRKLNFSRNGISWFVHASVLLCIAIHPWIQSGSGSTLSIWLFSSSSHIRPCATCRPQRRRAWARTCPWQCAGSWTTSPPDQSCCPHRPAWG